MVVGKLREDRCLCGKIPCAIYRTQGALACESENYLLSDSLSNYPIRPVATWRGHSGTVHTPKNVLPEILLGPKNCLSHLFVFYYILIYNFPSNAQYHKSVTLQASVLSPDGVVFCCTVHVTRSVTFSENQNFHSQFETF